MTISSSAAPAGPSIAAVQVSEKVMQLIQDVDVTEKDQKIITIASSELDTLKNALASEKDVMDRIQDILSEKTSDKQLNLRQLREITSYLKIAEHHLLEKPSSIPLAKGLHPLIKKIEGVVQRQSADAEAPWKTLVHAIDQQIAIDRKKSKAPPTQIEAATKSFLENRTPHSIDPKDFAHIHAESFITHTQLEGNTNRAMLKCFLDYSEQISVSSPEKQKLVTLCKDCLDLVNKFELDRIKTPDAIAKIKDPFRRTIQDKLQQLKAGESLLLPTGWAGVESSHAMYMLVTKEKSGHFDVKICNAGSGIDYHSKIIDVEQFKFQPYMQISEVEETSLGGEKFLTAYLEVLTVARNADGKPTDYGKKDVYEALFDSLGGKKVIVPPHYNQFIVGQRAGNCSWAALMVVALQLLGFKDFSRASYEIKLNSLCDFFVTDEKNLMLLQTSAELFAGNILNYYKQGVITLDELDRANEILKIIFTHVLKAQRSLDFATGNAETFDLKNMGKLPLQQGSTLPLITNTKVVEREASIEKKAINAPYDDFSWTKDPTTFLAGAKKFEQWYNNFPTDGDPDILKLSIIRFYEHLPMPALKDGFWDKMPAGDITDAMQMIVEFNEFCFREYDRESIGSERYVILQAGVLKSLAVIKNLALLSQTLPFYFLSSKFPFDGLVCTLMTTDYHARPTCDSNIYDVVLRQQIEGCIQYLKTTQRPRSHYDNAFIFWFQGTLGYDCEYEFNDKIIELRNEWNQSNEVEYLYNQLQNPDIRAKFLEAHPKARLLPEWRKLVIALGDVQGTWLPPAFAALKRQSYFAFAFTHGYLPQGRYLDSDRKYFQEANYENQVKYFLKAPRNAQPSYGDLTDDALQLLVSSSRKHSSSNQPFFTESIAKSATTQRINPALKDKDISLPEAQELMALMAGGEYDGDDPHLEMQAVRALSYFMSHKEKLQIPKYQALFRLLVFEGNHLEKLLELNPDFKNTMLNFIQKQMEFFRDRGDISTLCFLVESSRFFQAITTQKMGPDNAKGFLDPIKVLTELLRSEALTMQERTLINKHLAASFVTNGPAALDETYVLTLLEAKAFVCTHPESSLPHSSHLKTEYESVLKIYSTEIEKQIRGPKGAALLNQLTASSGLSSRKGGWVIKDYPICQSEDGKISIDISSGAVYSKNQSTSVLPNSILDDPRFSQVFARKDYIACKTDWNVFEFTDETHTRIRIIVDPDQNKFVVQKELIQGIWYELLDTKKFSATTLQSLGGKFLVSDYQLWAPPSQDNRMTILAMDKEGKIAHRWRCSMAQELTDEEGFRPLKGDEGKELRDFLLKVLIAQQVDENDLAVAKTIVFCTPEEYLEIVGLLMQQDYLKEKNPQQNEQSLLSSEPIQKVLKTPPDQLNPIMQKAQVVLKHLVSRQRGITVEAIEKVMPKGSFLSLAKIDQETKNLAPLAVWEPLLWKNQKGEPTLLEIPQIGQTFAIKKSKNTWEAHSETYPGLKISANQHVKGLEDFKNKIVLEGGKGNRKVLIPQLELDPRERGALTKAMMQKFDADEKPVSMIFDIDPKKGIQTSLKDQQLYLAYIELGQKNYRKSQEMLRSTYSKVIPYTDEERKILRWIVEFQKKALNGDPRACAVSMTALSLLVQDDPNKMPEKADVNFWKSVKEQYDHYARAGEQIGTSTLTANEDHKLLSFLTERKLGNELIALRFEKYQTDRTETLQTLTLETLPSKRPIGLSSMTREEFKSFCSRIDTARQSQTRSSLITRPGNSLVKQLFDDGLYQKIKEKSPEARLQLNFAHLDNEIDKQLVTLLEAVWKDPELFPDEQQFLSILNGSYVAFTELIMNRKEALKNEQTLADDTISSPIVRSRATPKMQEKGVQQGPISLQPIQSLPPILTQAQQKKYFQDVPFVGISLNEKEIHDLQDALDLKSTGSLGEVKTQEIQDDITAAWEKQPSTRSFLDPKQVDSLKTSLLIQQAEQKKLLVEQTQRLLAAANELPADVQTKLTQDIAWKATLKEPITFHDLCILIANKDFQRLKEKNSALDDAQINALYNGMLQVLERGKFVQKIDRSLAIVEDMHKKIVDTKGLPELRKDPSYLDLSQKLLFDLTRPTAYKVHEEPEYSLFEFLADMQLYQDQTQDLDILVKVKGPNDNIILQKIMGTGKSKVYLPILALKKADGKSLPVIVVTAAQYPTSLKDMEASSGQIFHQVTHTLTFDRATDCSLMNLQKIRQDMNDIIRKKHYMIVTDKTIHCLHNKYKEMTLGYMAHVEKFSKSHPEADTPEMPPELQELREILSILKKGVLDEADLLLNSKHEVNFTTGKPDSLDQHHAAVVSELFESIYSDPGIMTLITPKTLVATGDSMEPIFTFHEYNTLIKPKIAEAFIKFELESTKSTSPTLLGQYLKTLSPENRANIYDYLLNGDQGDAFVATLSDVRLQNVLAIAKEEINEILPLTLRKTINFHYGFSSVKNEHLAVPYVGNSRPSETSRYGNPYELLSYTIQTYFQLGIPDQKIRAITDEFKAQAIKEISADPSLDVTRTGAYAQFKELCGVKEGEAPYNLMRLSDENIAKIASRFKKDKTAIFEFLRAFVFPQVQIYPGKISSNHLTLVDAFESLIGFTGTPWNKDTYHKRIQTKLDVGTDGKTLGILWKNSRDNIHVLRSSNMKTVLDQLFKNMGPDTLYRTLKDSGALFNGIDNETVAREIMKRLPPHIKGVKFFNKENKLVILERGRSEPRLVEQSLLTPEECFTYYDQWNTTGKDIKQMALARGFATLGKTLTRRDLLQCVWRLREIDKGQVAELVIPPEVVDLISKEFHVDAKEASSLKYILKFVELNQLHDLERQLLTSTYHAIHHVAENAVDKIISRPDVDLAQLKKGIPYLNSLLNISTEDKPYDQFGRKEKDELTSVVMQKRIDAAIEMIKPLIGTHPVFDSLDLKKLEAEMQKVIPWALLPKTVPALKRTNRELTVEMEREVQREEEVNAQRLKEIESQQEYVDKRQIAFEHWNWTNASKELSPTSRGYFNTWAVRDVIQGAGKTFIMPTSAFSTYHPVSVGIPPVMTVNDIFRHSAGLEEYADVFDMEASYNFLPPISNFYMDNDRGREYAVPFDKMQNEVQNMLMVRDKSTNQLKLILIDQADVGYFYSALAEEKKKDSSKKELSVALTEMNLGVIQAESSEAEQVAKSSEWMRLLVQAKFFNGDVVYTKTEQKYLEEWILAKGPARMEKLFYEHILRHKSGIKVHYPHSILGRLFHRLQKS